MQAFTAILVTLACFAPLAFVLWRISRRPQRKCPACGQGGDVAGFGRFQCARCGHRFVLRYHGRAAPSLIVALLPPLCLTAVVFIVIAARVIYQHEYHEFWLLGLLGVQVALGILMATQTKKFANAGES